MSVGAWWRCLLPATAMDAKWKSSFGRSRTPMGAVPISVIYGYKYPLR